MELKDLTAYDWVVIRLVRMVWRQTIKAISEEPNKEMLRSIKYIENKLSFDTVWDAIQVLDREEYMVKNFGEQCADYVPGCACCEGWRLFFNNNYKVPKDQEVFDACRTALEEQNERDAWIR